MNTAICGCCCRHHTYLRVVRRRDACTWAPRNLTKQTYRKHDTSWRPVTANYGPVTFTATSSNYCSLVPPSFNQNFHLEISMYKVYCSTQDPMNRVNSINHQFGAKFIKWYHFLFLWETATTNFTILQKLLKVDWPWISAHWEIKRTASVEG
jgi:hypothetical protein